MNIFSILGLMIATGVILAGLRLSTNNMIIFLDYPSMFIVIGGTFAATSISMSLDKITSLFKIFIKHISGRSNVNFDQEITKIMGLCEAYRKGESLEVLANKVEEPFLKESLLLAHDGILDKESLLTLLQGRIEKMNDLRIEDAVKLKSLGKYPPAFGMMGTTIGMIVLLSNLGGEDAIKMIGPAMSVCLLTTLYGVIIANLFFLPVSENLLEAARLIHLKEIVYFEGISNILNKTNPVIVAENLNSFLPPAKRLDWKKMVNP